MINLSAQLPKAATQLARYAAQPREAPVKSRYCHRANLEASRHKVIILIGRIKGWLAIPIPSLKAYRLIGTDPHA
jgi:hypothetical protein